MPCLCSPAPGHLAPAILQKTGRVWAEPGLRPQHRKNNSILVVNRPGGSLLGFPRGRPEVGVSAQWGAEGAHGVLRAGKGRSQAWPSWPVPGLVLQGALGAPLSCPPGQSLAMGHLWRTRWDRDLPGAGSISMCVIPQRPRVRLHPQIPNPWSSSPLCKWQSVCIERSHTFV